MGWDNLGWDWDSKKIIFMGWDGTVVCGMGWDRGLWDGMGPGRLFVGQRDGTKMGSFWDFSSIEIYPNLVA